MKKLLLLAFLSGGLWASAESVTCTVNGPHCQGCREMIEGQVCDEAKYSTCAVKIIDEEKKIAEVKLVTKDNKAKVDQATLGTVFEKMDYKLASCKKSS